MKTLMIAALLGLTLGQAQAQKIKDNEVPKNVKEAFTKVYPAAKNVKWGKEEGSFEASFDQGKSEMSVVLDNEGDVTEVETEIGKNELPQAVQDVLKKNYAGYKIEEAAKILANGVTTYEAEVEKGKESFELIFDNTGKLLKKTAQKEEGEDKD
jgi:hypothetical protein